MENASRALILAAEILIGLAIIGIFVMVVNRFGSASQNVNKQISDTQIAQFNTNFYNYENRYDISAQEVATILNFSKKENDKRDLKIDNIEDTKSIYFIRVYIDDKDFFEINKEDYKNTINFIKTINQFLRENNKYYFECNIRVEVQSGNVLKIKQYVTSDIKINEKTNLVKEIRFYKVDKGHSPEPRFRVDNKDDYVVK